MSKSIVRNTTLLVRAYEFTAKSGKCVYDLRSEQSLLPGFFLGIGFWKGHSQLPRMRIRLYVIANLHITEKRSRLFLTKSD